MCLNPLFLKLLQFHERASKHFNAAWEAACGGLLDVKIFERSFGNQASVPQESVDDVRRAREVVGEVIYAIINDA